MEGHILHVDRGESCRIGGTRSLLRVEALQCLIDRLHTKLTRASDLASFTSPCRSPPPFLSLVPLPERLETRGGGHVQGEMSSGGGLGWGSAANKGHSGKTSSELA